MHKRNKCHGSNLVYGENVKFLLEKKGHRRSDKGIKTTIIY